MTKKKPLRYQVEFLSAAEKQLAKLPPNEQERITEKIDALSNDPRPLGIKALKGKDLMRLRVGDYRVIYQIEDDRLVVLIVKLGHRREVYR
jgi:mRNA interferase RelE/StbE